jgi:hypothetical protein
MSLHVLPIIVLAGSDQHAGRLPEKGGDKHPLSGYKAADIRVGEHSLIETLLSRLEASGRFAPIYVVGPRQSFGNLAPHHRLVDADGSFGENLCSGITEARTQHPDSPLALVTCDILPDASRLAALMDRYVAAAPCDLWYPLVRAPQDAAELGASDWKPGYRIQPEGEDAAVDLLPGHLAVVDPASMRLDFLFRLLDLGYRTRNRPINYRRAVMVRGLIFELLIQDLRHLFTLRAPTLTASVIRAGVSAASDLREGSITQRRMEDDLRKIFVASRHRRRYPQRRTLLPIVDELWLALDIDTEEEVRAAGGALADEPAGE